MKKSVNKIYIALREKEKNATIDFLRGDGCNDTAKGYLLGLRDAYRDIISIMESSNLIKFKKSPTR